METALAEILKIISSVGATQAAASWFDKIRLGRSKDRFFSLASEAYEEFNSSISVIKHTYEVLIAHERGLQLDKEISYPSKLVISELEHEFNNCSKIINQGNRKTFNDLLKVKDIHNQYLNDLHKTKGIPSSNDFKSFMSAWIASHYLLSVLALKDENFSVTSLSPSEFQDLMWNHLGLEQDKNTTFRQYLARKNIKMCNDLMSLMKSASGL